MARGMLSTYVCVGTGLAAGLYVGVFMLDFEPAFVGWIFGAGAGLSGGAFVAAIATNTPLAGSATRTHRGVLPTVEYDEGELDTADEDSPAVSSNGHSGNGSTTH